MKNKKYYIVVSLVLVGLSAIMFLIHYLVFGQAVNTAYYSLMNLCFIPVNSLVVTLILERLIDYKAKQERMEKLSMLIGLFFTEVGYKLMRLIIKADKGGKNSITSFNNLDEVKNQVEKHNYTIDMKDIDLDEIKDVLLENSNLLVNLISNENITEHEIFTDLLMSVIHLRDEIIFYKNDKNNQLDISHLEKDILRVYKNIAMQWVDYLKYLNKSYPFLYNNAIRLNPFRFSQAKKIY
ncbi:hypothetical protein [Terrisporobacter glycolicus]|uniref:Uncharacterized protein n=1 Tax=Terrisporobacter glycolicus ATCC 14880 = DSM 1288 TaxID=1121315 RepID=A0ABZ2EU61_9FIRM|nr:hypothetical protein [Terrisporobacter glycolicus]SFJ08707.1 hypothetical protein SAMN02910355_0948 [Terrisporobacter glycolicus]